MPTVPETFAFKAAPILDYPRVAEFFDERARLIILPSRWVDSASGAGSEPVAYVLEAFGVPDEQMLGRLCSQLRSEGKFLILVLASDRAVVNRAIDNVIIFEAHAEGEYCCGYFFRTDEYGLHNIAAWRPFQERKYFASFVGSRFTHRSREIVFAMDTANNPDLLIRDINWWALGRDQAGLAERGTRREEYRDILNQSQFALCPRGNGPSSIRRWESAYCGAIPVLIDDAKTPWNVDIPALSYTSDPQIPTQAHAEAILEMLRAAAPEGPELQNRLRVCLETEFDNPVVNKSHTGTRHVVKTSNAIWREQRAKLTGG